MGGAPVEDHLIVHLEMVRHSKTAPDRPECCIYGVSATTKQRLSSTPPCAQIYDIHTVEQYGACVTPEMARAHKIGLVSKVWNLCRQIRIPGTLWLVAPRTSVSKVIAAQDTIDGPKGWQGPDVLFLEFPQDGLSTTKQTLIVETEAGYLDDLLNLSGRSLRAGQWGSGFIPIPVRIVQIIAI